MIIQHYLVTCELPSSLCALSGLLVQEPIGSREGQQEVACNIFKRLTPPFLLNFQTVLSYFIYNKLVVVQWMSNLHHVTDAPETPATARWLSLARTAYLFYVYFVIKISKLIRKIVLFNWMPMGSPITIYIKKIQSVTWQCCCISHMLFQYFLY